MFQFNYMYTHFICKVVSHPDPSTEEIEKRSGRKGRTSLSQRNLIGYSNFLACVCVRFKVHYHRA